MLIGLSPNTAPPIKFKSVAMSSTSFNLSTLFGPTNAANYGGLSPSRALQKACRIELIDPTDKSHGIESLGK